MFVKLALLGQREQLVQAASRADFAHRVLLEVPLVGVPGGSVASVYLWPDPVGRSTRLLVDVVALGGSVLRKTLSFVVELRATERPKVREELPLVVGAEDLGIGDMLTVGPVSWQRVGPGTQREVQRVQRDGRPVFADVNTGVFCYRMTCVCGRVRFSKRNSVHQIFACRVCTEERRIRRKTLLQFRTRRR